MNPLSSAHPQIDFVSILRRLVFWGSVAYWLLLLVLTHIPLPKSDVQVNDKHAHWIAYALLAFLVSWWLSFHPRRGPIANWILAFVFCTIYGAIDELLQWPIPSRTADWNDLVADASGAACGAFAFQVVFMGWRLVRPSKFAESS